MASAKSQAVRHLTALVHIVAPMANALAPNAWPSGALGRTVMRVLAFAPGQNASSRLARDKIVTKGSVRGPHVQAWTSVLGQTVIRVDAAAIIAAAAWEPTAWTIVVLEIIATLAVAQTATTRVVMAMNVNNALAETAIGVSALAKIVAAAPGSIVTVKTALAAAVGSTASAAADSVVVVVCFVGVEGLCVVFALALVAYVQVADVVDVLAHSAQAAGVPTVLVVEGFAEAEVKSTSQALRVQ